MKTALELHKDADYYISVQNVKDHNGCNIIIPENIVLNIPKTYCKYVLKSSKLEAYISNEAIKENDTPETIVAPNYALRTIIVADLLTKIHNIGIDTSLIYYYNNDGDDVTEESNGIYGLIDEPFKTQEEKDKELFLFNALLNLFSGKCLITDEQIEEKGVTEGYDCILQLLRNGGTNYDESIWCG